MHDWEVELSLPKGGRSCALPSVGSTFSWKGMWRIKAPSSFKSGFSSSFLFFFLFLDKRSLSLGRSLLMHINSLCGGRRLNDAAVRRQRTQQRLGKRSRHFPFPRDS
jgi:hypothetical protein